MIENKANSFINGLLLLLLLFFGFLVWRSPLSYEGGDNFIHYKFAHYAWKFPFLFLDHWGKPLFTILCSPFAQFGFKGAKLFNVIVAIGTAYLTYRTALLLKYKQAWLAIIFLCFFPMYFLMFNTVMTEVLFSFVLILAVFLFIRSDFIAASVIISFLPFARSEGYLFIVFFAYALLVNKKIKYIPFLVTGFLLFSTIGYFYHYHDFFWVINQNPYNDSAVSIYGTGELLYFIKNSRYITGYVLSFLILTGVYFLLKKTIINGKVKDLFLNPELILILYPAICYYAIHSLIFWLGRFLSSVGELRVMAAIMPLLSLMALNGWNYFTGLFNIMPRVRIAISVALVFFIIKGAFVVYNWGYKTGDTEKVVLAASDWLNKSNYKSNKIYYYNPLFFISLDINPYDTARIQEKVYDNKYPEKYLKPGEIVIWDAHLGPNEGRLPLDNLLKNNHFKLLNLFQPQFPFRILGGYNYEIYIFQRVSDFSFSQNSLVLKSFDFENPGTNQDSLNITAEKSYKGKYCFKLDHQRQYSPAFIATVGELKNAGILKITASAFVYPVFDPHDNGTSLIISFERDTIFNFNSIELHHTAYQLNNWNKIELSSNIPYDASDKDIVKVFIYQPGVKYIFIDDFVIEVLKSNQ